MYGPKSRYNVACGPMPNEGGMGYMNPSEGEMGYMKPNEGRMGDEPNITPQCCDGQGISNVIEYASY